MIKFLKSLFKSNPGKKLLKERDRLYEKSVQLQRDGNLREYAKVMYSIEQLEKEYAELTADKKIEE
jgi:hypothetical protein